VSHVKLGDTDMDEDKVKNRDKPDLATRPLVQSAAVHYEASLAYSARLYLSEPENPVWQREVSWSLNKDGDFKTMLRSWEPAIASYEHSLCLRRRLSEKKPENTKWASDVSWTLQKLGVARLNKGGDIGIAGLNLLEMVRIRQVLVTDNLGDKVLVRELIMGIGLLAEYEKEIEKPEAVVALLQAISLLREKLKAPDGSIDRRYSVSDYSALRRWVETKFSSEDIQRHQKQSDAILNPIFQEASNIARPSSLDECVAKVNAALQALTLPEVRL
jgi:hypothetical protein